MDTLAYENKLDKLKELLYSIEHLCSTNNQELSDRFSDIFIEYYRILEQLIFRVNNLNSKTFKIHVPNDLYSNNIKIDILDNMLLQPSINNKLAKIVDYFDFIHNFHLKYIDLQLAKSGEYRKGNDTEKIMISKKIEIKLEEYENQLTETDDENNNEETSVNFNTTKDKISKINKQITQSLVRSNQILKASVLQTELNLEELGSQTTLLTELSDKFEMVNTVLNKSSKLIRIIERSGSQEKKRIYYSLGFLVLCISWVVWKRIIRGPLKLVLWIWFRFFKTILYSFGAVKTIKNKHFDGNNTLKYNHSGAGEITTSVMNTIITSTMVENITNKTDVNDIINSITLDEL
ncbi:uncharacterized protein SCODWIG_02274 [Saccharomycodes ludwigii]|uniref:Sec20 C-terminal domain-containing protein n=1 Tax=Saccharomycodes ludwigii TaxID=36035 RepID=A0A376B765_9ASCO|nr:uncharacterized protein SCODWIG_02274 [Saccharomycodes ludwigii]